MKQLGLALGLLLLTFSAHSIELTSRMGLGLSQQMGSAEIPMLTAHYYPNSQFGLSLGFGMDTEDDASKLGVLAKAIKIVFQEQQMNFYMGGAVGLANHEERNTVTTAIEDKSNFEISALIGGEFFFSGLDSLGLSFETGISVITGDDGTRFRTIADHPFRAGIVFYF